MSLDNMDSRKRACLIIDVQLELLQLELILSELDANHRKPRSCDAVLLHRKRNQVGSFVTDIPELRKPRNATKHFNYFRMTSFRFNHLLSVLEPKLTKKKRHVCPITPDERLCITLRFLASGDSMASIGHQFNVSPYTVSLIIYETCTAIWEELQPSFLPKPNKNIWLKSAKGYLQKWNYPNCVGSIDGKHVQIKKPKRAGSDFFNYKKFHSIVLMAVVGPDYEFIDVDVGGFGRNSDGGVFAASELGKALNTGTANLPDPSPLPGTETPIPYHIVGDEAFPMKTFLMRPFPGRNTEVLPHSNSVFNYRLSRARRTSENAFGILSGRFRVFKKPIECMPDNVDILIKAALVLHNYLLKTSVASYAPRAFRDDECVSGSQIQTERGQWRNVVQHDSGTLPLRFGGNNYSRTAGDMRECLREYFISPAGRVDWQDDAVQKS